LINSKRFALLLGWVLVAAAPCFPQSSSPAPQRTPNASAPASQSPSSTNKTEQEQEIEKKEQSQRALGVVPLFLVTNRRDPPPLSPRQKFHLFAKQAFDPIELTVTAAQAGLSQAEDEFPAYGQGTSGYAKRYGAALGDEVSSGFWTNFLYPTLFKEDPRYFRVGAGGFKHRLLWSVRQEFVCHTDKGGRSFSFANVLGPFTAGGISNIYYPKDDRGFELTMSRAGISLGYAMLGGLFEEFWPDIHDKVLHKHRKNNPNP